MTGALAPDRWLAVRAALAEAAERFARLVSAVPDPRVRATAHWTVADTAAHVGSIAWLYATTLGTGRSPLPVPDLDEAMRVTTVDTVDRLNAIVLRHLTDRDAGALVRRLRADIHDVLRVTADSDPATPVPWLGESRVSLAGVLAHMVNELLVHGWDIARATGTPWPVPARDAGLFFDLFVVGILRYDPGRLLNTDDPPRSRRIAVAFRSPHTTPVTLVLRDGLVSVAEPDGATDVRLSFDPAALNLMLFGRIGRLRTALTGGVVVGGPRPWLLPKFLRTVRLPH
jgi:uncharacterized protein (TIGR03083 family)